MNEGWSNELAAWTQNVTQRLERPFEIGDEVEHITRDDNIKTGWRVPERVDVAMGRLDIRDAGALHPLPQNHQHIVSVVGRDDLSYPRCDRRCHEAGPCPDLEHSVRTGGAAGGEFQDAGSGRPNTLFATRS